MKNYIVTIQTTGYTYNDPCEIVVYAKSNADAIKQGRKFMHQNGHTKHDGPVNYKARVDR